MRARGYEWRRVTYQGRELSVRELAERTGTSYGMLYGRVILNGMTVEEALALPWQKREGKQRRAYRRSL